MIYDVLSALRDAEGHSCLHVAMNSESSAEMEEFLLHHTPEALHIQSPVHLLTPLHIAVRNRPWHRLVPLLEAGAHLDVLDSSSRTPLDLASEEIREELEDYAKERASRDLLATIRSSDVSALERCLSLGAAPDQKDVALSTPLHLAAEVGNPSIFSLLLERMNGRSLDLEDEMLQTPLHVAALEGRNGAWPPILSLCVALSLWFLSCLSAILGSLSLFHMYSPTLDLISSLKQAVSLPQTLLTLLERSSACW